MLLNFIMWICCFMPLIIIYFLDRRLKRYMLLKILRNKRKGGERKIMKELLQKFLEKDCIINTINSMSTQYVGVIKEVTDGGVLIENDGHTEIVNIDFISHVKEYPVNKKGKRKIFG